MQPVVFFSAAPERTAPLTRALQRAKLGWTDCATWDAASSALLQSTTRVVFVDAAFSPDSGPLLAAIAKQLPHQPTLRSVLGDVPGLRAIEGEPELLRLATRAHEPELTVRERYRLELSGMGREAARTLQDTLSTGAPLLFWGERGTGKEWVARIAHRLARREGPFEVIRAGSPTTVHQTSGGTLYLEDIEKHDPHAVQGALELAAASGWGVLAGSRRAPAGPTAQAPWESLHLRSLRERPGDLRPLARLYVDDYAPRLGLGPKRLARDLWEPLAHHSWPGNQRELEAFIVRAITSVPQPTVSWARLPDAVRDLLDPSVQTHLTSRAFEHIVEDQLRPLVERYHADATGITLHRLVIDATERALVRVALQVTGNQKAAALLLGVARNTLRERVARLAPTGDTP